jgi:hypothetical protein
MEPDTAGEGRVALGVVRFRREGSSPVRSASAPLGREGRFALLASAISVDRPFRVRTGLAPAGSGPVVVGGTSRNRSSLPRRCHASSRCELAGGRTLP